MFTRCPKCKAVFRVQPEVIRIAQGRVRCSQCSHVFDALEDLRPTAAEFQARKEQPVEKRPSAEAGPQQAAPGSSPAISYAANIQFEPPPGIQAPPNTVAPASPQISEARLELEAEIASQLDADAALKALDGEPKRRSPVAVVAWTLLDLILIAALLGQAGWWYRDELLADPRARQALEWVCAQAGCQIPPLQAPERFEIRHRNVITHPGIRGVLQVELRFANSAPFPQPYPILRFTLYRADGGVAVRRDLPPAKYLPEAPVTALLAPAQEATVKLEVEDPGEEVTGFEFEFR